MASRKNNPKIKTDLLAASRVLQTVLGNGKSPLSDQFLRWKVWRFWPQIVGLSLGKICEPVGYDRGRLIVWTKTTARVQELRFCEETLIEKVNEHVGRKWVRSIRWSTDRKGVPEAHQMTETFNQFMEGKVPPSESEV